MRVCLLTPEFLPTWGGIGAYTYGLARSLRDRAEVHVVTTERGKAMASGPETEGIQVHGIHPDGPSGRGLGLSFQIAVLRRLPALAKEHRFDVVHANHAYMSDLLVRARRIDAARVVTVHTTLGTQIEGTLRANHGVAASSTEGTIARWRPLFRGIERHYLRRSPAMIFVSRWIRDRAFLDYGLSPGRSTVIVNGVDTARLEEGPRAESEAQTTGSPTLLFAGRLLALKGIGTLFRALARLDPRIRLLLAGPGDPAPWRSLAQNLGIEPDRYAFLGRVPYDEMPALYRGADAVVLPSFSESCPLVALEAMASGTPLVAANVGGVQEIVRDGETGWLFPPGDAEALADGIEDVLSNPQQARAVSRAALSWVENHATLEHMAGRTFEFYEAACGEAS